VELLTPTVQVYVHPIDTARHPSIPPGWRWAVHVGGRPPADLRCCVNAGWEPDRSNALLAGEQVGVAVTKAFAMCGLHPAYTVHELGHDPTPAD
jgi:hypothetical protein